MSQCDSEAFRVVTSCSAAEETAMNAPACAPPSFFVDRPDWPPCLDDQHAWMVIAYRAVRAIMELHETKTETGTPTVTQAAVLDRLLSSLRLRGVPMVPYFRDIDEAGLQTAIDAEPGLGLLAEDLVQKLLERLYDDFLSLLRVLIKYVYYGDGTAQPYDMDSPESRKNDSIAVDDGNEHDNTIITSTDHAAITDGSSTRQLDGDSDPTLLAMSLPFKNLKPRFKLEDTAQWGDFALPVFYLCSQAASADDILETGALVRVVQGILSHLRARDEDSKAHPAAGSYFDGLTAEHLFLLLEGDAAFSSAVRDLVSVARAGMASQKQVDDFRQALRPVVNHLCTRRKVSNDPRIRVRFDVQAQD